MPYFMSMLPAKYSISIYPCIFTKLVLQQITYILSHIKFYTTANHPHCSRYQMTPLPIILIVLHIKTASLQITLIFIDINITSLQITLIFVDINIASLQITFNNITIANDPHCSRYQMKPLQSTLIVKGIK